MSDLLKKEIVAIKKPSLNFELTLQEGETGPSMESYAGGKPFMTKEEEIQTCPNCKNKMVFVLQLAIPEKRKKEKNLYSFQYCFNCAADGKVGSFALNIYKNPTIDAMLQSPSYVPSFPKHDIDFYPAYEIPEWEYMKEAFPDFYNKLETQYGEQAVEAYMQVESKVRGYYNNTGLKFGGHPETIMYGDVPDCPVTGEKMEPLISMESIPELNLNWLSDESYLILFKSKNHEEFALRAVDFKDESFDDLYEEQH